MIYFFKFFKIIYSVSHKKQLYKNNNCIGTIIDIEINYIIMSLNNRDISHLIKLLLMSNRRYETLKNL